MISITSNNSTIDFSACRVVISLLGVASAGLMLACTASMTQRHNLLVASSPYNLHVQNESKVGRLPQAWYSLVMFIYFIYWAFFHDFNATWIGKSYCCNGLSK